MKKIILCPNPNRDRGMEATRRADAILREMGFQVFVLDSLEDIPGLLQKIMEEGDAQ